MHKDPLKDMMMTMKNESKQMKKEVISPHKQDPGEITPI